MFVYARRMIKPKIKTWSGNFSERKDKARFRDAWNTDYSTRDVCDLLSPHLFATLPKRAVKSSISHKKLQCYRWTCMISMKPWPYQFIHSFVNHILNFDMMKFIVFTKLFDNQSFSWCWGANDACPERLKCKWNKRDSANFPVQQWYKWHWIVKKMQRWLYKSF